MTRPEREGRLGTCNGVAYVQFLNAQEAEVARQSKHKEMMGNRYIECMTHIPKGAPAQGQQEGGTQQAGEAFAPAAEQGGVPVAYQQQQPSAQASSQPASAASSVGAESGEYLLPNDFFRNINKGPSVGPHCWGRWRREGAVHLAHRRETGRGDPWGGGGPGPAPHNMLIPAAREDKLSEKGGPSSPPQGFAPWTASRRATTAAAASFMAVGGAHPPGYGPADPAGGRGLPRPAQRLSGPQDDPPKPWSTTGTGTGQCILAQLWNSGPAAAGFATITPTLTLVSSTFESCSQTERVLECI